MASCSTAPRVLLVGDSGVGKSLLLHLITSLLASGRAAMPPSRIVSTVGFDVMVCAIRKGRAVDREKPAADVGMPLGTTEVKFVEFVEVGGNRTFHCGSRAPVYQGISAVIFVYDSDSPGSLSSLVEWYNELDREGVLGGARCVMLVGTELCTAPSRSTDGGTYFLSLFHRCLRTESGDDGHRYGGEDPSTSTKLNGDWGAKLLACVFYVSAILDSITLWFCSVLLFGGHNAGLSGFGARPPRRAVEHIRSNPKCTVTIDRVTLWAADSFGEQCDEMMRELSLL